MSPETPAGDAGAFEPASTKWPTVRRRLRTIPAVFIGFAVVTVSLPFLLPLAIVIDLARWVGTRRHAMAVRLVSFLWVYLSAQVAGLSWMFISWLLTGFGSARQRLERNTYRVQALWARYLFRAVRAIFGLRLSVSGEEALADGRAVFMPRHASLIDTLLPSVLITAKHGIRLRYVLKKELLADPALDVAGNRIPNYFVDRAARRSRAELAGIARLAEDLAADEGVLIYPEGTRFRPERRAQAIKRLANSPEFHELADSMQHVHPPRPAGALALLDSGLDAVFCAHAGLDGFARVSDVWDGSLVGKTVSVRFRRVLAGEIPTDRRRRSIWLFEEWQKVDADVGRMLGDPRPS